MKTAVLSPLQRSQLEFMLMYDDFRHGAGDARQRMAFEEYEWRRIEASCKYFIKVYGYLMQKDGSVVKWHMWDFQEELFDAWQKGENTCAVKARQLGVTTCSSHFATWEVIVKAAVRWYAISQNEESAKDLMSRVQATLDRLPQWILERGARGGGFGVELGEPSKTGRRRGKRAEGIMKFACGMSQLLVLTSTPESTQGKAGKFILDEFSKHRNQKAVWQLVWPSFTGGGQAIIIANGNGKNTFYHIYQGAKKGKNNLKARFYSWKDDPTRDASWYQAAMEAYMLENPDSDEYAFRAMYPSNESEAFFLTGNSRFDLKRINILSQKLEEEAKTRPAPWPARGMLELNPEHAEDETKPKFRFLARGVGRLLVWELPQEDELYVIGCDPSGGKNDYAVASVGKLDVASGRIEQVALFRAVVEPEFFAYVLRDLGEWYNQGMLTIERNNDGRTTIRVVKEWYHNLYYEVKMDKFVDDELEVIGYNANRASKADMINGLAFWIAAGKVVVRSEDTLNELAVYEIKENQTTSAPLGEHDDCVIALGLMVLGARDLIGTESAAEDTPLYMNEYGGLEADGEAYYA